MFKHRIILFIERMIARRQSLSSQRGSQPSLPVPSSTTSYWASTGSMNSAGERRT